MSEEKPTITLIHKGVEIYGYTPGTPTKEVMKRIIMDYEFREDWTLHNDRAEEYAREALDRSRLFTMKRACSDFWTIEFHRPSVVTYLHGQYVDYLHQERFKKANEGVEQ